MITNDELVKIAALAKLSLDGENISALARDMEGVLDFATEVSRAPIPSARAAAPGERSALRADSVVPSLPSGEILRGAGESRDGFFVARETGGSGR